MQNRLEHTINNLDVAAENMQSANSQIRDTDMAKEMMEYTKKNVLTQAAQAMLAQANQQPRASCSCCSNCFTTSNEKEEHLLLFFILQKYQKNL